MNGKLEAQKTWGASPTGSTSAPEHEPGTREFFDKARRFRDEIEQPWLSEVFPFADTRGKRVLEIGFGPGYDTLKFYEAGADYSGIDLTPENVVRAKKHLAFFGFTPDVREGDAEQLVFDDGTFDFVYSNGVLHHIPHIDKSFAEAYRVLKPGGEFCVLLYHRYSVNYAGVVLIHFLSGRFRKETLEERRSRIESSTANARPIVNVYSRSEVKALLRSAGFEVKTTAIRKFVPEDIPGASKLKPLYQRLPNSVYRTLGRYFGWYVIARAVKPG